MKEKNSEKQQYIDKIFGLDFNEIKNNKSVRRAASDAISLGEEIVTIGSLNHSSEEDGKLIDGIWQKKQKFEDNNFGDEKYISTITTLVNGFFHSEEEKCISGFDRLNLLKNILDGTDENGEELRPKIEKKRFNLREFLGDKFGIKSQDKEWEEPNKATEIEPKESPTARWEKSLIPYVPAHPDAYGYPERSGSTQPPIETGHTMWRTEIKHRKRFKAISLLTGKSQQEKNEDI